MKSVWMHFISGFHRIETRLKMRTLGLGKKMKDIKPLNEEMAVELGADLFGEVFIFSVATLTIFAEYSRQKRNETKHEEGQEARIDLLERTLQDMDLKLEEQNTKIKELTRLFLHNNPVPDKIKDSHSDVVVQVVKWCMFV